MIQKSAACTIIAMCRRNNQAAFRLDPLRGNKPQHALAILTATTADGFVAEQIQLVQENDAQAIKKRASDGDDVGTSARPSNELRAREMEPNSYTIAKQSMQGIRQKPDWGGLA